MFVQCFCLYIGGMERVRDARLISLIEKGPAYKEQNYVDM